MSLFLGLVVQSVANNVLNNVRNVTEKGEKSRVNAKKIK